MDDKPEGGKASISVEDLSALNAEIAVLVRAGIPLEQGLARVGDEMPGRLGAVSRALATRMERGESLPQALAAEGDAFPPLYRAVVEAGVRSGRLGAALEGMTEFTLGYSEVRKAVGLALFYPVVVLMIAYGLSVLMVLFALPRFLLAYEAMELARPTALAWLAHLGDSVIYWGPVLPALVVLFSIWWLFTGRSASLQPGWSGGALRWIPGIGSMLAMARAASFAELMALLLEHRVPYGEAARLAARATGDAALERSGRAMAEASERGEGPDSESARLAAKGLPPMLAWLIGSGGRQGSLPQALKHAAETYRRRAIHRAEVIRVFLPTLFLLVIGLTAVMAYALILFMPLTNLLLGLSRPR